MPSFDEHLLPDKSMQKCVESGKNINENGSKGCLPGEHGVAFFITPGIGIKEAFMIFGLAVWACGIVTELTDVGTHRGCGFMKREHIHTWISVVLLPLGFFVAWWTQPKPEEHKSPLAGWWFGIPLTRDFLLGYYAYVLIKVIPSWREWGTELCSLCNNRTRVAVYFVFVVIVGARFYQLKEHLLHSTSHGGSTTTEHDCAVHYIGLLTSQFFNWCTFGLALRLALFTRQYDIVDEDSDKMKELDKFMALGFYLFMFIQSTYPLLFSAPTSNPFAVTLLHKPTRYLVLTIVNNLVASLPTLCLFWAMTYTIIRQKRTIQQWKKLPESKLPESSCDVRCKNRSSHRRGPTYHNLETNFSDAAAVRKWYKSREELLGGEESYRSFLMTQIFVLISAGLVVCNAGIAVGLAVSTLFASINARSEMIFAISVNALFFLYYLDGFLGVCVEVKSFRKKECNMLRNYIASRFEKDGAENDTGLLYEKAMTDAFIAEIETDTRLQTVFGLPLSRDIKTSLVGIVLSLHTVFAIVHMIYS